MPTYDLATRFLPEDHSVWALHPGRGKRQYQIFSEFSVVFLEIPGFGAADNTFEDPAAVRQHLRMSDAIIRYLNHPEGQTPPARIARAYSSDREIGQSARSFDAAMGNIDSLYREALPGDLILVPGRDQYVGVLAGELLHKFSAKDIVQVRQYPEENIPTRPVQWISSGVEKRHFSKEVARRLENRHAIIAIRELPYREEIYKKIYGGFSFAGTSKADFFGAKYASKDPSGILATAKLVQYFASAFVALEAGASSDLQALTIDTIIAKYPSSSIVKDFAINFSSPGKITLVALSGALALAAALGVAVAVDGISYSQARGNLALVNSANVGTAVGADGDGALQIYSNILEAAGEQRFKEIQELARQAKDIDLKTPVKKIK